MSDLALFDFDGTLTDREMLPLFVRAAVRPTRLRLWGALLAPWLVGDRLPDRIQRPLRAFKARSARRRSSAPSREVRRVGR